MVCALPRSFKASPGRHRRPVPSKPETDFTVPTRGRECALKAWRESVSSEHVRRQIGFFASAILRRDNHGEYAYGPRWGPTRKAIFRKRGLISGRASDTPKGQADQ